MKNFKDLNISESLMSAITELGYEAPTPIQAETLPLLLGNDTDFLGLAATGTGKTAAFGIPLLERIDAKTQGVQALVLCPTRELAIQVAGQIDLLGKFLGIKALPVYGGTGYGDQIYGLKNGATIVVGTPGRVVDHIEKGILKLNKLKTLVLDEADEMISMGFKEDLEKVLDAAPKGQANIWLFSATMGREVRGVADAYLKDPQKVQINRTEMLPATVEQIFYKVHEYDKPEVLCKVIDVNDDFYGIVFCQTKALVADLTGFLLSKGYRVDCLHGDLDQTSRDRVMKAFRDHKIAVLIATDVACRGLDVKDITHVVNYSIPRELDNYVHRIGRTGRSGKKGVALSFVTASHRELIGRIERMTSSRMVEGSVPTQKEITLRKIAKVQENFDTQGPQARTVNLMPQEWKDSLESMSKEEIAGRFLTLLLPDLFAEKKTEERMADSRPAPREDRGGDRGGRRDRGGDRGDRRDRPPSRDRGFSGGGDRRPERSFSRDRAPDRERRPERSFDGGGERRFTRERPAAPAPRMEERAPAPARDFAPEQDSGNSFAPPARRESRPPMREKREGGFAPRFAEKREFRPRSKPAGDFRSPPPWAKKEFAPRPAYAGRAPNPESHAGKKFAPNPNGGGEGRFKKKKYEAKKSSTENN